MPFQSEAQRRKFAELLKQGKISQKTFDEWNKATGKKKLPERVGQPKSTDDLRSIAKRFGGKK